MLGNHWEDDMRLTKHARQRIQQRGISTEAVDAILAYGPRRRNRGADIYYLDKKSRRRLAGAFGRERYSKRSEEHTSELQSLMRISYDVFCLKKKKCIPSHTVSTALEICPHTTQN